MAENKLDERTLRKIGRGTFMGLVLGQHETDFDKISGELADVLAAVDALHPGKLDDTGYETAVRAFLDEAGRASGRTFDNDAMRRSLIPMLRHHGKSTDRSRALAAYIEAHLDAIPD